MSTAKTDDANANADAARARLAATGRNDLCPCGSGKKYKKCHLAEDEAATAPVVEPPKAEDHVTAGWRLFEQRRPGAAEKSFRQALDLRPAWVDAMVGIGMAKLSQGENAAARSEFDAVIAASDSVAKDLAANGVKDAFTKPEAQSYIRAAHALGCLSYDEQRYDECVGALERVYSVDEGTVGVEARLVAAKALMKLGRAKDAADVLAAVKAPKSAIGRAQMGVALARFATGDRAGADQALAAALESNPHFGKAILGQVRRKVDAPVAAPPGSPEEAVVYAQTYGDVWDDAARAYLTEALGNRTTSPTTTSSAQAEAGAP